MAQVIINLSPRGDVAAPACESIKKGESLHRWDARPRAPWSKGSTALSIIRELAWVLPADREPAIPPDRSNPDWSPVAAHRSDRVDKSPAGAPPRPGDPDAASRRRWQIRVPPTH